jgi:nitrogenase molybdenum-iron protein alpha/beta subunit
MGALAVTAFVRDAVTIIHGPSGCAHLNATLFQTTLMHQDRFALPEILSSSMSDQDVIFGGEDALRASLEEAIALGPDALFVVPTCVSETIGDDVATVCSRYSDEIPVVLVNAGGFIGGTFQDGFIAALEASSVFVTGPGTSKQKPSRDSPVVTIVGEKNLESEVEENYAEISRLLGLLGVEVSLRFVRDITVGEMLTFSESDLILIRDDPDGRLLQLCSSRSAAPVISGFPEGFKGSSLFLQSVAGHLGLDPTHALAAEADCQSEMVAMFEDLRGLEITFDSFGFQNATNSLFTELEEYFGITLKASGIPIPVPFTTPVGSTGIRRMLREWRRFI